MATDVIGGRLFAFIVAIDVYLSPRITNLTGCIRDGQAMRDFLIQKFAVPDPASSIKFLRNKSATRVAIIQTFRSHLTHNNSINKQDLILFFFSGHGCRVEAPKNWATDDDTGKVEAICPYDTEEINGGTRIFVIPDRTLGGLIAELEREKGNNIVVIMDSCHSGSGTRALGVQRCIRQPSPLPDGIDADVLGHASPPSFIPPSLKNNNMGTHVLLAACRQDETAIESRVSGHPFVRGVFTNALIAQLQVSSLDQLTYEELISKISLPYQTPQCEGANKKRVVFTDANIGSDRRFFPLKDLGGTYMADAGRVLGVVRGTEFDVYKGTLPSDPTTLVHEARLGSVIADTVEKASCTLQSPQFAISLPAYLRVANWNNAQFIFKVHFSPDMQLTYGRHSNNEWPVMNPAIVTAKSHEDADIVVVPDGPGRWKFQRVDYFIGTYADVHPKHSINTNPLLGAQVLDAAAHFHCHLYRALRRPSQLFRDQVTLKMHSVFWNESVDQYQLVGNESLLQDNHARLVYDDDADDRYAFTISNQSNYDLFPYLFFLDSSTYAIHKLYFPASARMHAPLRKATRTGPSELSIGYGSDGCMPFDFHLEDDENKSTCFLVLYVSTVYVDMDPVLQASPFPLDDRIHPARTHSRSKIAADANISGELWQAWTSIMTLTRKI